METQLGHVKLSVDGDVRRLSLGPGDRVLITFRERLPITAIAEVKRELEQLFPRNEVLIIAGIEAFAVLASDVDVPLRPR